MTSLFLSRLAIGVAQIACGLSGGLILDDARNAVFVSLLTCFDFGSGGSIGSCLTFGRFSLNALELLELYPFPLGTPFLPGLGCCHAFFLPCEPGRLSGFLCGTIGLEESRLRLGSGTAAVGKIIVSGVFQICVPFEVSSSEFTP